MNVAVFQFIASLLVIQFCYSQKLTPSFDINLDDVPEIRWNGVLEHYKDSFTDFKQYVEDTLIYILNGNKIPTGVDKIESDVEYDLIVAAAEELLFPAYPKEYQDEIRGISNVTGISIGTLALQQGIYDITAYCTSIVAEDKSGAIYHARNLDYGWGYGLTTTKLQDFAFTVNFKREGKLVYSGSTIFGLVGFPTGCGFGRICVTVNEHDYGSSLLENLKALVYNKKPPVMFYIRDLIKNETVDFEIAVNMTINHDSASPFYLIISGTEKGQGAVITRTDNKVENIWRLADSKNWYIVQTNNDHWLPPNKSFSSYRRQEAMKHLNALGQENLNYDSMLKIMNMYPTDNNGTVYSVVLNAGKPSFYKTYIPIIYK